jgi:phage I-like protein
MSPVTRYAQAESGALEEPIISDDGSLWSHAATLGTRFKGSAFTIDKKTVDNFIKVFSTGFPRKLPVDYEHGTVNGATDRGQPVPKAGDILEIRGVYDTKDFTGDLLVAAEKLTARMGRELSDPNNFGLWMRWRPTARALQLIKDSEYSELSIAFSEDYPHNITSQGQGPTLLSVALTNTPFLDDMVSIAATRSDGGSPAAPATPTKEHRMPEANVRLLTAVAAVTLAAAPADEDQAEKQLTQALPDINRFRTYAREVAVELGESEATPAVDKIRKLKAKVAEYEVEAEKQRVKRVDSVIATVFRDNEGKLLPESHPAMQFYRDGLRAELMAGTELEKTKTMAAIKALKPHGITEQSSAGDDGRKGPDDDDRLLSRAREIMDTDEEVRELHKKRGRGEAWMLACDKAEDEFDARAAR